MLSFLVGPARTISLTLHLSPTSMPSLSVSPSPSYRISSQAIKHSADVNGAKLMWNERLGFLGTCPSNLGTGLRYVQYVSGCVRAIGLHSNSSVFILQYLHLMDGAVSLLFRLLSFSSLILHLHFFPLVSIYYPHNFNMPERL